MARSGRWTANWWVGTWPDAPACRSLAAALAEASAALPGFAEFEPGPGFTARVVGRTTLRPAVPGLPARVAAWWQRAVTRPRFPLEVAYVLTLVLMIAVGDPVAAFRETSARAAAIARPGVERAVSSVVEPMAEAGSDGIGRVRSAAASVASLGSTAAGAGGAGKQSAAAAVVHRRVWPFIRCAVRSAGGDGICRPAGVGCVPRVGRPRPGDGAARAGPSGPWRPGRTRRRPRALIGSRDTYQIRWFATRDQGETKMDASEVERNAQAAEAAPRQGRPRPGVEGRRDYFDDPRRKAPVLALVLSLMPGLGQIYVGYYQQGFTIALIVASVIGLLSTNMLHHVEPLVRVLPGVLLALQPRGRLAARGLLQQRAGGAGAGRDAGGPVAADRPRLDGCRRGPDRRGRGPSRQHAVQHLAPVARATGGRWRSWRSAPGSSIRTWCRRRRSRAAIS